MASERRDRALEWLIQQGMADASGAEVLTGLLTDLLDEVYAAGRAEGAEAKATKAHSYNDGYWQGRADGSDDAREKLWPEVEAARAQRDDLAAALKAAEAERDAYMAALDKAGSEVAKLRRFVWGAVHNSHRGVMRGPLVRWSVVSDRLGVGCTTATTLCREHGVDPHEQVGEQPQPGEQCDHCGSEVPDDA